MATFLVEVQRETWATKSIEVEAEDKAQAEVKALAEASDTVWDKIPDAEYSVVGTKKVG